MPSFEAKFDGSCFSMTIFCDNESGLIFDGESFFFVSVFAIFEFGVGFIFFLCGFIFLVVVGFSIEEEHDVGVLFDRAGVAQV